MARPKGSTNITIQKEANAVTSNDVVYVFSTLACDQNYTHWANAEGDMPIKERSIFIKGGTGVANDRLITPIGVMTAINADDYELLKSNKVFQMHQKNGFIVVKDKSQDAEKVASEMSLKDESAPLTDSDFTSDDKYDGQEAVLIS